VTAWFSRTSPVESCVVEVPARVGYVRVRPSDLPAGLFLFLDPFLLAGQVLLRPLQLLLRPPQEPGRSDLRPVIEHREVASASLNTTRAHPNARVSATCWPGDG
jgi:hypothetical protein